MAALLKLPSAETHVTPQDRDLGLTPLLNRLRFHATRCRASSHLDLYEACRLLDPTAKDAEALYVSTLLRILDQALGRTPLFYRPGEATRSFDETWITALIEARMRGDAASYRFLISSRVAREKRRSLAPIISGLSEILTKTL